MAVTINASTTTGLVQTADTSGVLQLQTNSGTTALTIDASQNVGIGTDSPSAKLNVVGSFGALNRALLVTPSSESAAIDALRTIAIQRVSNDTQLSIGYATTPDAWVISSSYGSTGAYKPLAFATSDTERMRIDSSGNVVVGTTTFPTSTVSSNGVGIFSAGGVAGRINYGKTSSGTENSMANYHSGTYVGGVTYSNTATAFPTSSDLRLKKDIVDAPESLDKINSIRIVSHGWKHDDDVVKYGVIAQELYLIASQAVLKGDDGEEVIDTWSVDYSKLVPMLVKAIQEQQTIINDLKARITALEGAA